MKNLPINLDTFSFYEREKVGGEYVKNKCGRDFLYYALCYYLPEKFGNSEDKIDALKLDQEGFFGRPVPFFLAWTQIQFYKIGKFLKKEGLALEINKTKVNSFVDFVSVILFSRIEFEQVEKIIEEGVEKGRAIGIDIPLKLFGLLDHVVFVYGYDNENYYVFDTRRVHFLNYTKITDDNRYFMKISKREIKERWNRFGRVWEVSQI